jgi:hypothetical protein
LQSREVSDLDARSGMLLSPTYYEGMRDPCANAKHISRAVLRAELNSSPHPRRNRQINPLPLQHTSQCLFSEGSSRRKSVCHSAPPIWRKMELEKIANEGLQPSPCGPSTSPVRCATVTTLEKPSEITIDGIGRSWNTRRTEGSLCGDKINKI